MTVFGKLQQNIAAITVRLCGRTRFYFDYASITPIDLEVLSEMNKGYCRYHANPSALHRDGVAAHKALSDARLAVAKTLHAHEDEIIFTASGTEANNLALRGVIEACRMKGIEYKDMHVVVSAIEHQSVLAVVEEFRTQGVRVDSVRVDTYGVIDCDALKKVVTPHTTLVSVMAVNNEVGSLQPLREIAKIVRDARKVSPTSAGPLFHTDASQAFLYEDISMEKIGIDLMTLDGHKICGPRGVGVLYVRRLTELQPIIVGGGQEKGLRAGTENIPGIVGMACALVKADLMREKESMRVTELRNFFEHEVMKLSPRITCNGRNESIATRAPHISNIQLPEGINAEFFMLQLDARGFSVSTRSACVRDGDESYVIRAFGGESSRALRISFGRFSKKSEVKKLLIAMDEILKSGIVAIEK